MTTAITLNSLKIYENLKKVFQESEAKTLTKVMAETIEESIQKSLERYEEKQKNVLATKEDINLLKKEIYRLETKMTEIKAEIIKWMFLFWIGQIATIIAVLFMFFK